MLDPNELPISLLREADGSPATITVDLPGGPHADRRGSGRRRSAGCRCCCWTPTSRPTTTRRRWSPTGSTAATASTGCSRRCCSGIGGVRALRAFSRITGHPAPEVFHTNEGHAGFLGLERIRELVAEDGPRLDFETALEVGRGARCSPPTPRCRPASTGSAAEADRASTSAATGRCRACRWTGSWPGRRGLPGRRPSVFNMAVMGLRLAPSGPTASRSCTAWSAGRCSTACGRASTRPRCRSARSPTACTPDLGGPRGHGLELGEKYIGPTRSRPERTFWAAVDKVPARDLGGPRTLRERLVARRPASGWPRRGPERGTASPAELGWVGRRARPRRADHRLRPAGADLQAAHPDAARPRPAGAAAARTPSARCSW